MVLDKKTGKFYGSAFVEFETQEAAKGALGFNGKKILGREMKVGWASQGKASKDSAVDNKIKAAPLRAKPEGCTQCFLGNLPFDVEEDDIYAFFEGYGTISEVRWLMNGEEFRGAGFVEFSCTEDTDLAVQRNGESIRGRAVRVDYAPYREGRG
jgi:RNA recognition motif-containing protein